MYSTPDYVPFSDVVQLCLRAAGEAPQHPQARHLILFRDWTSVDESRQRKAIQGLGCLMADLIVQSGANFIICSPRGMTLRPSLKLLSLSWKTPSLSLDDPLQAYLDYADRANGRYKYLSTEMWCVRPNDVDPRYVDIDEETGEVWVDPVEVLVSQFDGWALAVNLDQSSLTTSAILDARFSENAARATVLPIESAVGRPNKIDGALKAYDVLYPEGHAAANASVKAVLNALKKEGHSISEPTLHRGLSSRKVNP
jgi:hypothetical protein